MNIFRRELKAARKSLILWCIAIVVMVASGMGKYAGMSMSGTGQSMNDLVADMPKSLQIIMGIGTFDLSKASGYYGVLFLYLLMMATIHAAMLGANIISKEERDKTAEFLLVKPVSRSFVLTAKLLAAVVNVAVVGLVMWISSVTMVNYYSNGEYVNGDIALMMAGMFILQLLFLLVGAMIAAVSRNPKRAVSWSAAVLLVAFMLSLGIDLSGNLDVLAYVTPFKYFEAKKVMYGGGLSMVSVWLSVVIIAVCSTMTYVGYNKRDLNM
ncbi:ABC transporter permease subunit [Paenibacillus sp. UMB4589-SE434]|uniref:ABC transporter permease subunit n=1 Tax=Paenibacillus sp. UMB4589-SE434 TaxID=3046314 RepID=UPI00254C3360|nr:ABC transporter permease subunit [Paenibacillus sp. UMB4589-SE434]MDK8181379.1 ABC transporter permease subunit [Paenibacillus sp. UMB4589-SE434]